MLTSVGLWLSDCYIVTLYPQIPIPIRIKSSDLDLLACWKKAHKGQQGITDIACLKKCCENKSQGKHQKFYRYGPAPLCLRDDLWISPPVIANSQSGYLQLEAGKKEGRKERKMPSYTLRNFQSFIQSFIHQLIHSKLDYRSGTL